MTEAQKQWERCRHWIEAAVDRSPGLETIEDVERMVESGNYIFWPGKNCAAITEMQQYAQKKALCVMHGGGDLRELVDELEPALCSFALAAGCDMLMGVGRKGWIRETEKRGYRFGFVTMVKNLKQ